MTYRLRCVISKGIGLTFAALLAACTSQPLSVPPINGANQTFQGIPQVNNPQSVGARVNEVDNTQPRVTVSEQMGRVSPGEAGQVALLLPIGAQKPNITSLAQQMQNAAKLAAQSIQGATIDLRVYDTAGNASTARSAADLAISDGADIIIGPLFSHSVEAVSSVANPSGITTIAFSTDTAVATPSTFLIGFLPQTEIRRVVTFANKRGINTLALLAPQTPYGEVSIAAMHQSSAQAGSELSFVQRYVKDFQGIEKGTGEFAKQFQEADGVRGILIPDSGQALQTVASFLSYHNITPGAAQLLGTGLWDNPSTLQEDALQGGWFATSDPKLREIFSQKYADSYGSTPEQPIIGLAFDAVAAAGALMVEAARNNDPYPFTPSRMTDPAGFAGVNGIFRFTRDGLNERGLSVMKVQNGDLTVIDPAPSNFTGPIF